MADRIFDPDNPAHAPTVQDFDGGWHTFGSFVELDEAGDLTGGSAWFPNPKPANFRWVVFKVSDHTIIAEVNLAALSSPTLGDYNDFTSADFLTPGDVPVDDSGTEQYIVAYATNGDFTYRDSSVAFPYGDGVVHATQAAFFNGGAGPTYPDGFSSAFMFPADMIVEAAGGPVAAVGQSTAAATATSAAAKTSPATGTAAGAPATTSTAVKVVHCTATCSAAGSTSAAATADRRAAGTTTAAPSTTATASKTIPATGTTSGIAVAHERALDIRNVTATCYGIAVATARHRRVIQRPSTGVITRPYTGVILRP